VCKPGWVTSGADLVELHAGELAVTVAPSAGSRLASVRYRGHELLVTEDASTFGWGSYVMAPFAGRIGRGQFTFRGVDYELPANMGDHAIHGTVYESQWTVQVRTAESVLLACDLGDLWPFRGQVSHSVSVSEQGDASVLTQTIEVEAIDGPMPAWAGWHPWWSRTPGGASDAAALTLSADWSNALKYERDAAHLPTGRLVDVGTSPWDDCFVGVEDVKLSWPGLVEISLTTDARSLVIYDEPGHAICVEPQSAPPDAVNLDPGSAVTWPGSPVTVSAIWSFRDVAR
jgi:aldose 1-epimerase